MENNMLNFKNYLLGNDGYKCYGQIYYDHEKKQAVYTDGRFMILSKEMYNSTNSVEYIAKKINKEFDWKSFNYIRAVPDKYDLIEINFQQFSSDIFACNKLYAEKKLVYKDLLEHKVYFKEFDVCLTFPIIYVIRKFIEDNINNEMKVFMHRDRSTYSLLIESYNFFNENEIENSIIFMPAVGEYEWIVDKSSIISTNGKFEENIERLYSWSDMANEFTSRGIPHEVVRNMADVPSAWIWKRPLMNIFKFDKWLHEKYGDYESEGKSMHDIFNEIFGGDSDKMAYYFGISNSDVKENNLIQ